MAMEPTPVPGSFGKSFATPPRDKDAKGKGKGKGKFGSKFTKRTPRDPSGGRYTPKLLGKAYFQRKKGCPFSGPRAPKIDYKDVRLLSKYVSEYGKILPRHLTGVCALKQRELATAIKRARMLALLAFTGRNEAEPPRRSFGDRDRAPREGGREGGRDRAPREPRAETAAPAPAAAAAAE